MTEQWRPVPWAERYEVSDMGRVRSLRRGRHPRPKPLILSARCRPTSGCQVALCVAGVVRHVQVARLVLETFVGPCPPRHVARRLNGDATDECLANLCWAPKSDVGVARPGSGRKTWTPYRVWLQDVLDSGAYCAMRGHLVRDVREPDGRWVSAAEDRAKAAANRKPDRRTDPVAAPRAAQGPRDRPGRDAGFALPPFHVETLTPRTAQRTASQGHVSKGIQL